MTTYEIMAVLAGTLTVVVMLCTAIIYLVRKNDKVVSLSNELPEVKEHKKKIDALESRLDDISNKLTAAFREIDTNRENISYTSTQISEHTKRMEESNSLILKAITGLVSAAINGNDKNSLAIVKDMLERETIVVTKRFG